MNIQGSKMLFVLINMNLGGTEKSFLNLIDELPTDFDITVLLLERTGKLMDALPPNIHVRLIDNADLVNDYLKLGSRRFAMLQIEKGNFILAFRSALQFFTEKIGISINPFWTLKTTLQPIDDNFDIAIAYAGTHNFIAWHTLNNIRAKKKVDFYNFDTLDIDYFSYLKILKEGHIIFWKDKVYHWRKHNSQETDSINFQKSLNKYAEYNDLLFAYKDIDSTIKNVMLKKTYFDLTVRLLTHFFNEEFSMKKLVIIVCKTKLHSKYWKPILSLAKNKILK